MTIGQTKNGIFYYRFQIGKRPVRKQGFKTRSEAERAEAVIKAELLKRSSYGEDLNNKIRLSDACDVYYEEFARPFKQTWRTDRAQIRAIKSFFGNKRIRDISPRDVERFRLWIPRNVKNKYGEPLGKHTINHYHAELKAIINWAKKKRIYFGENPAWGIPMYNVPKAKVRYLLPEEELRLTPAVAKNKRLWPYYVIGLHTGMRLGEVQRIRVKDLCFHGDPSIFIPNSKTSRSRYVPLHGIALEIAKEKAKRKDRESILFEAVTKTTISKWFNEALYEANVGEGFTFHCLRHTFAGHMLGNGVPIYIVSKILGHSTVRTTEDHYGHLDRSIFGRDIHKIGSVMTLPKMKKIMKSVENAEMVVKSVVNMEMENGFDSSKAHQNQ